MEYTFNFILNYIADNINNAFYHIRILLNDTRKNYLKKIASEILLGLTLGLTSSKFPYYSLILDTTDTNLYKSEQSNKQTKLKKKKYLNIPA